MMLDKNKIKYSLYRFGLLSFAIPVYLLFMTFFGAYFSPDGSGTILIGVNWLGEANLELVMFCFLFPLWGWVLWVSLKNVLPKIREADIL